MYGVSGLRRVRTRLSEGVSFVARAVVAVLFATRVTIADEPKALELRAPMKPQMTVGLVVGGGAHDLRSAPINGAFRLGAYSDILFFRRRGSDMALGPFAEVVTTNLTSVQMGGGLAWLIPLVADELPFVLSGGLVARKGPEGWGPLVTARLFWGSRSFNFHKVYGTTVGFFFEGRVGVGGYTPAEAIGGLQLDASFLAFPFMLAASAAK